MAPTEPGQEIILQLSRTLGRLGKALLALRLFTLLPRYPRYTLTCTCLLAVFWASRIFGEMRELFTCALVVATSRDTDIKLVLKLYLVYFVFFLVACPISYFAGLTGNVTTHFGRLKAGSYGFGNPNTPAAFLAMAIFLGLYLSKEKRVAVIWAVCWFPAALVFLLTLCLTQTLLLLALPVFYVLLRQFRPRPGLLAALPPICLALSIILACYYGPGDGSSTFESRFSIAALVYEKYGLSLFGQDCGLSNWFHGVYPFKLTIDNGYLNVFLRAGIVPGLVVIAFLTHLFYLIGKKGDALLSAIACCIIISGLMEQIPFLIGYSFLPLLYLPLVEEFASSRKKTAFYIPFALVLALAVYVFLPWHPHRVSPHPYGTVRNFQAPAGFINPISIQAVFPAIWKAYRSPALIPC